MTYWYQDMFCDINLSLTKKPKSIAKLAKYNNNEAWQFWFSILVERALNRYYFTGLPDTVSERVLLLSLLYHASVCFFEEQGHVMALPGAAGSNGVTVYGDFTYTIVYGRNGWTKTIPLWLPGEKELKFLSEAYLPGGEAKKPIGVWFRENPQKKPFIDKCIQFADQLADAWVKLENARAMSVHPLVLSGLEQDKETADRVVEAYVGNIPYIYVTRKLQEGEIGIDQLQGGDELRNMSDHIIWLISQFDVFCGKRALDNPDKGERVFSAESMANIQRIYDNIDGLVDYINKGLDEVNLHFNTNIRCHVRRTEEVNQNAQPEGQGMVSDTAGSQME